MIEMDPKNKSAKQVIKRIVIYFVLAYSSVVMLMGCIQNRLIYLPAKVSPKQLSEVTSETGLKQWPEGGDNYRALMAVNQMESVKGTILLFHGNAGMAANRSYYINALKPLGYRVILNEYPTYGARSGQVGEDKIVADGKETLKRVLDEFDEPLYLWGESLGCGVVAAIAADESLPVRGVIMLTPWDTLPDLAQSLYWFLPVKLLLQDSYDSIENLKQYPGPVAVLMAKKDRVIPNRHTERLYRHLETTKQLWTWEQSGHNDWMYTAGNEWWEEVMQFIEENQ